MRGQTGAARHPVGVSRPLIGITANVEPVAFGAWQAPVAFVPCNYVDAVHRAGGRTLLLAPDPWACEEADAIVAPVDALLLSGGCDVDPGSYGAARHPETVHTDPERDLFEFALVAAAERAGIPVLGICRGMQVLNVARGGTLVQHLPDHVGHIEHRRTVGTFDGNRHPVALAEGSLAARVIGELEHDVASHHHQGVDEVGERLVVTGGSAFDALPEAVEDADGAWLLGVQWHPESDPGSRVVASLVQAARERGRG